MVRNQRQDTYFILYNSTSVETVLLLNSARVSNYILNHYVHETMKSGYHDFKKGLQGLELSRGSTSLVY